MNWLSKNFPENNPRKTLERQKTSLVNQLSKKITALHHPEDTLLEKDFAEQFGFDFAFNLNFLMPHLLTLAIENKEPTKRLSYLLDHPKKLRPYLYKALTDIFSSHEKAQSKLLDLMGNTFENFLDEKPLSKFKANEFATEVKKSINRSEFHEIEFINETKKIEEEAMDFYIEMSRPRRIKNAASAIADLMIRAYRLMESNTLKEIKIIEKAHQKYVNAELKLLREIFGKNQ
jgi:hypothetical protein